MVRSARRKVGRAGCRSHRAREAIRTAGSGPWHRLHRRARRGVRAPRARTAPARRRPSRSSRASSTRTTGRVSVLDVDPAHADRQWRERIGHRAPGRRRRALSQGARGARTERGLLPEASRRRRGARARRTRREGRCASEDPLGRPATSTRCRLSASSAHRSFSSSTSPRPGSIRPLDAARGSSSTASGARARRSSSRLTTWTRPSTSPIASS